MAGEGGWIKSQWLGCCRISSHLVRGACASQAYCRQDASEILIWSRHTWNGSVVVGGNYRHECFVALQVVVATLDGHGARKAPTSSRPRPTTLPTFDLTHPPHAPMPWQPPAILDAPT